MDSSERPLIVAAYCYGEPFRKRRVKVPTNTKWKDFLALIYSRLEINPASSIEIYDEQGIEIVDVDDLVENDILVVRHMPPSMKSSSKSLAKGRPSSVLGPWPGMGREGVEPMQRHLEPNNALQQGGGGVSIATAAAAAAAAVMKSHDKSHDLGEHSMMVSTPQLSHFIQLNSFGYYFLAEVENMKLVPTHGKIKRIHCIVKVPHCQKEAPRTFSDEANLLRKVSNHKSIVSPPSIQILNFSDDSLQHFFSTLLQQKQVQVRELFMSGGCMEAYIYPLYGVTMATRIKNGLTPDKVLKYSYQLADIMFYLQQRGVIHQNLLPENIQVMSNDRVVLCNFETAVQTNPTSCLLVAPQSVVAPGNRKGLAPEVVRSFSQLSRTERTENECIDYSTQYPWSFGVLSVIMATGHHPLKDYPKNYESGNKVKYRSHDYQALPDSEQYPPIFCKLVKRSLSCDPIRRPTLPQILSIIKKDSKIIALMTGKRFGGPSSSAVAQQRGVVSGNIHERRFWGSMESINRIPPTDAEVSSSSRDKSPKVNHTAVSSTKDFYDTHPPVVFSHTSYQPSTNGDAASDATSYQRPSHVQQHQLQTRMDACYESHEKMAATSAKRGEANDPFLPRQHHSDSTRRKQHSLWDTFGEEQGGERDLPFYSQAGQPDQSPPTATRHEELTLRRHSSSGAFSDDFVLPLLSRESGSRNIPQSMRRVGSSSRHNGSSERLLGRSGTTSESDLSQIQEFQYHRLGHSPDDRLSLFQKSDQERLLHVSSPEIEQDLSNGMQEYSYKTRHGRSRAQPGFSPDVSPCSKVARRNSYQRKVVNGKLKVESPLSMRRCLSDDRSLNVKERDVQDESMDITTTEPPTTNKQLIPRLNVTHSSDHLSKQTQREADSSQNRSLPSHQHTNSNSSSTGPDGILMSTTNTETQTTSMSLDLASQSQRGGEADVSGSEFIERMDTQSGRESSEERVILLSPVFSTTESRSEVTPVSSRSFWTNSILADSNSSRSTGKASGDDQDRPSYRFSTEDSSMSNSLNGRQQGHQSSAQNCLDQATNDNQDEETVMISPITLHSQSGLDIFPNALSLESNTTLGIGVRDEGSVTVRSSQVPLLGGEDEELTPREDGYGNEQQLLGTRSDTTRDVAAWVHEDLRRVATSQATASTLSPSEFTSQDTSPEGRSFYPLAHHDYSMMSPIPEASQELTSSMSMSQPNTNLHRLSGSHMRSQSRMRSVSPISEQANISVVDEGSPPPRHGSISPFRHSAVGMSDQNSTLKSESVTSCSERGSTAQSSTVTVLNTRPQQQSAGETKRTSAYSSSVVTESQNNKDQERKAPVKDDGTSYVQYQPRSRSATPLLLSGANSREGSVSSIRGRTPQTDRTEVHGDTHMSINHPTIEQLSNTSSGSREASQTSSGRAQVTIDVSGAVRALTSQTAQPSSSRSVCSRTQRVTNYSREPIQTSMESLGRESQVRGTTPQSSCSAPARIQNSVDTSQRSDTSQQLSSLLTTTAHRHSASLKQHHQLQLQGGSVAAAQTSKRYSQQRMTEPSSRNQQRIHQDIEMMHLAISGMDSTQGRGITRSDVAAGSRGPTYASRMQTSASATSNNPSTRVTTPHTTAGVELSRTFRPITPAVMDTNTRPVSAPVVTASARPSSSSTITPVPTSMATVQQQQPPPQPSIATVSQSARTGTTSSQTTAHQPPHVSADSYDYLPPYSPPQSGGRPQQREPERTVQPSSQQRPQNRQVSEPPLYPEPPPSYDEIFGGPSSGGRQRRRRGQRRQGGAESSNDGGNRRSRSQLRRSSSQNEGPIRPSASQRRLASLTNLFRRARRHTQSASSQNQRTVRSEISTSINATSVPMDANEYVASWVESYSRTPRPAEAFEARSEELSSLSVHSHVSRAVSDITNSRPHPTAYQRSSSGANPVPYRPPPPFPTSEGADSAVNSFPPPIRGHSQTDYGLAASRASSDVGHSRVMRNGGQRSRPNSVAPEQQLTRPVTANMVRRRELHEQQRRPASAIITSEVAAANTVTVQAAHSGTDLIGGSQVESGTPEQRQQQLTSHHDNTAHISNSCFDISTTETRNEQQVPEPVRSNQEEPASPPSRQEPEAAASQAGEEQAYPVRTGSGFQQHSQSMSLSQEQSQGDSSNLAANVNANNINTSASPRASNASSPINMVSIIGSNSSIRHPNSQPISPVSPILEDSIMTGPSQPVQDPPLTASSPLNGSNSEMRVSVSSGLSSRAAARQRAEMRLSQQDIRSSSDEESSQISDRSQSGVVRSSRQRHKRRRSQGSVVSPVESLRSNSRSDVHGRPADVQEETEMNVESHARSHDQPRDDHTLSGTAIGRLEEEQEVQTVEVAIEDVSEGSSHNQLSLLSSGKSCGHSCEAESQDLCCLCTVEQRTPDSAEDNDIIRALSNCSLCQRRCDREIQQTHSYSNKIHSHSEARSSPQTAAAGDVVAPRQRGGKNCIVM